MRDTEPEPEVGKAVDGAILGGFLKDLLETGLVAAGTA